MKLAKFAFVLLLAFVLVIAVASVVSASCCDPVVKVGCPFCINNCHC